MQGALQDDRSAGRTPTDDPRADVLASDETIRRAAAEIRARGYAEIPDAFSAEQLEHAQRQVGELVASTGGNYASAEGGARFDGYILNQLGTSAALKQLCGGLYGMLYGKLRRDFGFYQVLRCLTGRNAQNHSYYFHYDSFAITALAPLAIPATGKRGDLLLFPNARNVRATYFRNVLDKIWMDRAVTQKLLRFALDRWLRPVRIRLNPGSLYLFLGYRSLHTNEPCDEQALRATVLFHCIDPHADAVTRKLATFLRNPRKRRLAG